MSNVAATTTPSVSPSRPSSSSARPAPLELTTTTTDGASLALRFFDVPAGTTARGAVFFVTAMGVPQRFYEPLARWLAEQGFAALTFDYRGMGLSRSGPLCEVAATIETWGTLDTRAALLALAERTGSLPITWIGHSLGGQIVPFLDEELRRAQRVQKIVTVAAGSGYWRENSPELKRRVWLFWFGAVPLTTPLLGYFPGKRLGMVGDLPRGVIEQWRRWCLDREYAVGAEGPRVRALFAAVQTPITSLSFTDDEMMSAANTASLHGFYTGAPRSFVRLAPADVGVDKIGHFGFFRRERAPLWASHLLPELVSTAAG
jgi:predicted alpha/beta hydrolase